MNKDIKEIPYDCMTPVEKQEFIKTIPAVIASFRDMFWEPRADRKDQNEKTKNQ